MKYQKGSTVLLLDTTFKAVCPATVKSFDTNNFQYEVEYVYPGSSKSETIWVVQERLATLVPPPQL